MIKYLTKVFDNDNIFFFEEVLTNDKLSNGENSSNPLTYLNNLSGLFIQKLLGLHSAPNNSTLLTLLIMFGCFMGVAPIFFMGLLMAHTGYFWMKSNHIITS